MKKTETYTFTKQEVEAILVAHVGNLVGDEDCNAGCRAAVSWDITSVSVTV